MGLEALFTCEICKKQQKFSGEDAIASFNIEPWQAIPNKKKPYYSPWGNKWDKFDAFAHEWLCSLECMDKWVKLDPKYRLIFVATDDYDKEIKYCPSYIVRRSKNYIWLCLYNAQFKLSTGQWTGRGGYHGRCYGKIREEDRLRLKK